MHKQRRELISKKLEKRKQEEHFLKLWSVRILGLANLQTTILVFVIVVLAANLWVFSQDHLLAASTSVRDCSV